MASTDQPRFSEISKREHGLRRTLSSRQLAMIAVGGAIGTGLFLGSGFAIGLAGPAVLISYLIGAVITLLLMGCLAEMSIVHPVAGSFGAWAEMYISPLAGFLVRVAYWAGVVFALGTEISAVAVYMRFWFPTVPGWIWICGFSAGLVLVNASTVRLFGSVEYVLSLLKITAIVAFLVMGSWIVFLRPVQLSSASGSSVGLSNYTNSGGFFAQGFAGVWLAVLVSLFSYFSIEMIAVAAGEASNPRRAVLQAFRATMLRLAVFYLCTLALVLAIVPWRAMAEGQTVSPFVIVMSYAGLPHAAGVVNFVILIAALSAINSQLYITARMLFSLARAGQAPAVFATLSSKGVPVYALLASTGGIALAAVLSALYHERSFLLMLSISMFGPLFTWFMIFVTHLRFRRRHARETLSFRMWGYPFTSLLGALLMLAAIVTTWFAPFFKATLIYGLPFLLLLFLVHAWRTRVARVSSTSRVTEEFR